MALIAELTIPTTYFQELLARYPDVTLHHEVLRFTSAGELHWALWVAGSELNQVHAILEEDATFADVRERTALQDRRLFEVRLAHEPHGQVYAVLQDAGAQILDITISADESSIQLRFPSREQYRAVFEYIDETYGPVVVRRLFDERPPTAGTAVLTPKQQEAICHAYHAGYFHTPRQAELKEIAAALEISDTAVSQRIRGGIRRLVGAMC